jgi:DNA replication protein DnaC
MNQVKPEQQDQYRESIPASPNPEKCSQCKKDVTFEWVRPVLFKNKIIGGTGSWESRLSKNGTCPECHREHIEKQKEAEDKERLKKQITDLLGGPKAYDEYTFDRFSENPSNKTALENAINFDPRKDNLYFWGPCGVGKTHLASAIARTCFKAGYSVILLKPSQLMRRIRKKDPDEEQKSIDSFSKFSVFVLDELGIGNDTAFARQVFQEILDSRNLNYRAGLILTTKYSPDELARKLGEDTVPSRLAGMCKVIKIEGNDHRIYQKQSKDFKLAASGEIEEVPF